MNAFDRTGTDPYSAPALPVRVPGASMHASLNAMTGWQPPRTPEELAWAAGALRNLDDRPPLERSPVYDSFMTARHGTGAKPQATFTPKHAPAPAPLPVRDAIPGNGMLRWFLADLAAIAASAREPIFSATCPGCQGPGGMCRHHEAMAEESAGLGHLAEALGAAATDQDAVLLIAAAATTGMPRPPADPEWPGHRDRAVLLLTEAESAALPETAGCCDDGKPCDRHARDQDAASFVGAIRDAAIDASSAAEAAALITAVITDVALGYPGGTL